MRQSRILLYSSWKQILQSVTLLCDTKLEVILFLLAAALKGPGTELCQTASALRNLILLREESHVTNIDCIIEYLGTA
jgi:hypothetical protein